MLWFFELLARFEAPVRVLDLGGTPELWKHNRADLPSACDVTFLNLYPVEVNGLEGATSVVGDARKLTAFADGAFDVCFSNSVIEHVGTLYDQLAMANEIRRVCRGYFVQTPNRYFPIEPHFLVPFWQFLPFRMRSVLLRFFSLGWMRRQPDWFLSRAEVEQVRLLSPGEMRRLFPDAELRLEQVGPLIKSLVAIRSPGLRGS